MGNLFISAAHKSSGKTTISIGLCAALTRRGLDIRPFKKGPDYIDPMWLGKAASSPCYNLDFNNMEPAEITQLYQQHAADDGVNIIEGNKGLYDGLNLDGSNSNAALATLLNIPVILVIDAQGMTRGIAPLILGYQDFEPNLNIAGVILNKLGGSRHESKLRAVIEHYTDVPVIGAVHRNKQLQLLERHLGLIPSNETSDAEHHINAVADVIEKEVDLDALLSIASISSTQTTTETQTRTMPTHSLRIGIAQDSAFGFYYPDDLETFINAGVELVPINTLCDQHLPEIDGLFIGGGFPETHMQQLEANKSLRDDIKKAIKDGLPTYAECGGLMYLTRSLQWQGQICKMVGAISADTIMHERPQGRGYVILRETERHPWKSNEPDTGLREFRAHEFHYSTLENVDPALEFAYDVLRGSGIDGKHDGIICHNVVGSYSHFRDVCQNNWIERFLNFVQLQTSSAD